MAMKQYDVFISYSHKDFKVAKSICKAITEAGLSCFFDEISMENPEFWPILAQGIKNCKIFLYLGSNHTAKAKITPKELGFAIEYKEAKYIYPYFIDDSQLPEVHKLMLSDINQRYMSRHPVDTGLIPDLKRILEMDVEESLPGKMLKEDIIKIEVGRFQLEMIRVEGGQLGIGATQEQEMYAESNEYPSYVVTLPAYYMAKYPITQDIWEYVMGYNKSYFRQKGDPTFGHYPAEHLTHDEAMEFVRRLSKVTNIQFSLPTEEEWEYAARGGQKSQGFKYAGSNDIDEVAWYKGNAYHTTHPVGEKKPNELGFYDMSGNVWEWTKTPALSYGSDAIPGGNVYIRRGGSWFHEAQNCRVSMRYPSDHSKKTSGLGLRVVIRENVG
ncbi:MAG: SUMF1/EgtB/PvdO family nonheme iron enzyme [Bacteroidales bacterium]|nr:SUMF1/EgtB/PvdO family nonheme iron enzyme [Bacteroidales bacterium]